MQLTEHDIREGIGSELADILHRQKAIVTFNQALNLSGSNVKEEFRSMAEEDDKNLRMLETVIGSFGIRLQPNNAASTMVSAVARIIADEDATPIEKLGAYLLIKQNQMMCSHIVHKSVQLSKPDVKAAVGPFDGVYATFTKHVSELNMIMEKAGVEWITGTEPKLGLIGRARDAISTLAGAVMSKTAKPGDEKPIFDVLKLDHRKVEVLFKEIEGASDPVVANGIFEQLKADLTAHSIAEEETVYRAFEGLQDMKAKLGDADAEHEEIRSFLDDLTEVIGDREQFLDMLGELKDLVKHHVNEEEGEVFDLIAQHSSESQRIQLSQAFLLAKQKIQENIGAGDVVASPEPDEGRAASPG